MPAAQQAGPAGVERVRRRHRRRVLQELADRVGVGVLRCVEVRIRLHAMAPRGATTFHVIDAVPHFIDVRNIKDKTRSRIWNVLRDEFR